MSKREPIVFEGQGSAISNYFSQKPDDGKNWAAFDKKNSQHMQILSLARTAQWTVAHDVYGTVPDLKAISSWIKQHGPVKKPMKEMSPAELSKTIVALGGAVEWIFKKK